MPIIVFISVFKHRNWFEAPLAGYKVDPEYTVYTVILDLVQNIKFCYDCDWRLGLSRFSNTSICLKPKYYWATENLFDLEHRFSNN